MVWVPSEDSLNLVNAFAPLLCVVFSANHLAGTQLFADRIGRPAITCFGIRSVKLPHDSPCFIGDGLAQ